MLDEQSTYNFFTFNSLSIYFHIIILFKKTKKKTKCITLCSSDLTDHISKILNRISSILELDWLEVLSLMYKTETNKENILVLLNMLNKGIQY